MNGVIDWLNDNSGAVQTISTCILVIVTAVYAYLTSSISRNAATQAKASIKMAEEMREQTIELRKTRSQQIRPVVRVNSLSGNLNGEPRVTIRNVGRGDATNGTVRIEWRGSGFKAHPDWSLSTNEEKSFTFAKDDAEAQETVGLQPRVVIECDDNNGVRWRSGRNLRVVNDNTGAFDPVEEFGPEEVQT